MRLGPRLRASFSRGFGGAGAEVASASLGRSHSRSAPAPGSRLLYPPASGAACCSDVGSVCAFQNSQTSQECWLARAAAKHLPWLHCTFPPLFSDLSKKKKFVFSTLNNYFHWGEWDGWGARVMIVVEEYMGGVVLCVGGSTSDLWEDGRT